MFTLIALGTAAAFGYSVFATCWLPAPCPTACATAAAPPVYFEAAAVIVTLVLLGQVLELRARSATGGRHPRAARPRAEDRAPRCATTAARRTSPLDDVRAGRSAARAARREGARRRRRARGPERRRRIDGDRRADPGREGAGRAGSPAARVNGTGGFVMRAERVGADTLLAQIVRMVGEAQRSRAPIQRLADVVASWFVPAVVAVAVVTALALGLCGPRAAPRPRAGQRRRRAHHRLPVRARPRHADVDHGGDRPRRAGGRPDQERRGARASWRRSTPLVVDKTGTLTEGKPRLVAVVAAARVLAKTRCCALAAAASSGRASTRWRRPSLAGAAERGVTPGAVDELPVGHRAGRDRRSSTAGAWRSATRAARRRARHRRDGARRACRGTAARRADRDVRGRRRRARRPPRRGRSRSRNPRPRPCACLRAEGVRVVMLTGDSRTTAEAVARTARHRRRRSPRSCPPARPTGHQAPAGRGPRRGHGRRRRQRRARAGRRRTSASPWAPAPTSPWRAPASRS